MNIKKFILEITEPYIRTTRHHADGVRETRYSSVKAAPFSFHLILNTSYTTTYFFHSAFLPRKTEHRKVFLHTGGTKNIPKWDGTTLPQQAALKQWCCCKVPDKPEELSAPNTAVHKLKINPGLFFTHHS